MKITKLAFTIAILSMLTYIFFEHERGIGTVFSENRTIEITQPKAYAGIQKDYDYSNILQVTGVGDNGENIITAEPVYGATQIVITAAGDCTLGSDDKYSYGESFMHEYERQNKDYSYFMRNVADIFGNSDLAIVNLEVPLTDSVNKADKEFAFRGLPEFTGILKSGNIDAVAIANNHTKDYLMEGYNDTKANLEEADIMYFGNDSIALTEIKGIKVGMYGFSTWYIDNGIKNNITNSINRLRDMGAQIVIAYFHWGDENAKFPNEIQMHYAHFAIDNGTDLVLGSHPHVIQGIEEYKGKQIVYSLGNFCFGGNRNPSDKDTYIFSQTFTFVDGELQDDSNINIIPASVSSITNRNNFQPTPLEGDEHERVANKIIERSISFNSEEVLRKAMKYTPSRLVFP